MRLLVDGGSAVTMALPAFVQRRLRGTPVVLWESGESAS